MPHAVVENFDLLARICGFLDMEDLLKEVQFVDRLFFSVVNWLVGSYLQSTDIFFLSHKATRVFPSPKLLCSRIVSNRKSNHSNKGGFLIVGGCFNSFDSSSCWIVDSTVSLEGEALDNLDALHNIGASPTILDSDGRLRAFGGWSETSENSAYALDDCLVLENFYQWKSRRSSSKYMVDYRFNLPQQRCFSTAVSSVDGNFVSFLGGCASPYRGAEVFDTGLVLHIEGAFSDQPDVEWQASIIPPMSVPRGGHVCVSLPDNNLVVAGGYGGDFVYHNSVELFDWARGQWISLPGMECKRSGAVGVFGPENAIYVAGGSGNGSTGEKRLERLDLRMGKWEQLADMHCPRGYTAGAIGASGYLFITGGLHNSKAVAGVEYYDARMNRWCVLPGSCSNLTELVPSLALDEWVCFPEDPAAEDDNDLRLASERFLRSGHQMIYVL